MITEKMKIRLFNSSVKSVLLYGAGMSRARKSAIRRLQTFSNWCLCQIEGIHWPQTINQCHPIQEDSGANDRVAIEKEKVEMDGIGYILREILEAFHTAVCDGTHKDIEQEAVRKQCGGERWRHRLGTVNKTWWDLVVRTVSHSKQFHISGVLIQPLALKLCVQSTLTTAFSVI